MAHRTEPHRWGPMYEHNGTTYRECAKPECDGHQEWICVLDRWSDAFETPSPRRRAEVTTRVRAQTTRAGASDS